MMGQKVRWVSAGTRDEVSFSFPQVQPGEASCELCCQGFANTRSFKKYMRTHSGDTGYSWEDCSEVLTSRVMPEHVFKVMGRRCNFIVLSVSGVTQPNKPWWLILGLGMGLPLLLESYYMYCVQKKGFQSAEDHEGTHGLYQGAFSMLGGWLHCWSFLFSFLDTWLKSMDPLLVVSNGVAYYMCVLGLQWSLLYLIVWEIWGGGIRQLGK